MHQTRLPSHLLTYVLFRALDGSPATLDVLASVTEAVADTGIPVFLDGGIRAGMDVFKAVALGEDVHM